MGTLSYITLFGLTALFTAFYLRRKANNPKKLPLPPGPPPLPLIGNLFDMPVAGTAPWLTFSAMAKTYGDIVHLKVLDKHTIIVSSLETASDLFDQRYAIYSDRFPSVMVSELIDMHWSVGRMNYGDKWRRLRKVFHHYYSASAIRQYDGIQFENVRAFLKRLRDSPEKFLIHSRFVFAALIMNVTYGVHIEDEHNKHLVEAEAWQHGFNQAIQPGHFWVDYLPILKYVPAWFPGASFKRKALRWRQHMYNARDGPFNEAKAALAAGMPVPSIVTDALENMRGSLDEAEQELRTRHSLGTAFGAGVDTSAPTLQIFFYLMLTNPDVQKKAQAELERVIGSDRLPSLDDRPNLPYVEAVLKELLRWHPVIPLALPHATATSDEYRGYHIPKDAIVLGNAWHILHDPVRYPCPDEFRPERFLTPDGALNSDVTDPSVVCFGFGRRICPGRYLSLNSLFTAIACVLHTFSITPSTGERGQPIKVELRMQPGMICHPESFSCSIQVRSSSAESLITG
ncbi:unnamed protein product [Somion occarium]|uniref:Cytochrome P450 n=1 Tax=Somion occarium TaxID=3059160 RepID=A0ABP1D882_9APHY